MPRTVSATWPEPALTVTGTTQRWEDLQVGSLALATAGPGDGWYEAIITEARGDMIFVLRWQGWLDYDPFVRRADGLALLQRCPWSRRRPASSSAPHVAMETILDIRDEVAAARNLAAALRMVCDARSMPSEQRAGLCELSDALRRRLEAIVAALDRALAGRSQPGEAGSS